MSLPYETLEPGPDEVTAPAVLARLVDAMGFRYRWATEGLDGDQLEFCPVEGAFTLGKVLVHMNLLVRWVDGSVRGTLSGEPDNIDEGQMVAPEEWGDLRADTLTRIVALRDLFSGAQPDQLAAVSITGSTKSGPQPFWSIINGPLADFLTHVGQVASWRRLAGNPAPRADVFRGLPPRDV
ncbi:MAG: hypothetical protein O2816_15990 [Planctomycetota bacterium]|nr:hypothetical protein [Planctomycetota bacterium]